MAVSGFSVILVPADRDEPADEAFAVACALARPGARLIVAHVVAGEPDGRPAAPAQATATANAPAPGARHDPYRPVDPTLRVEHAVRTGPAAEAIVRLAEELACELIVIGAHGVGEGCGRLSGGVAQDVLRQAACPVLCLPAATPAPAVLAPSHLGAFQRVD
jgi:nucleotide-binding universal stress UspA family protein